ncbi:hypothetical protein IOD13_11975 [Brevibacterium casei]|nr:hypothetical protein [Brevibacterium casei]
MAEHENPGTGPETQPEQGADVRESFKGRIKSEPTLGTTQKGKAAFYAKVERRHWDYEDDGTYTRLPNTYHDLVAYKGVAVRAYKQLAKNDFFIAEGRMEDYQSKSTGETKQRFVATALGHDMARTTYEVDRTPRREQAQRPTVERDAGPAVRRFRRSRAPERQVAQSGRRLPRSPRPSTGPTGSRRTWACEHRGVPIMTDDRDHETPGEPAVEEPPRTSSTSTTRGCSKTRTRRTPARRTQ